MIARGVGWVSNQRSRRTDVRSKKDSNIPLPTSLLIVALLVVIAFIFALVYTNCP